jgi:hypothetical protein
VAEGTVRLPLDSTGKILRTQTVTVASTAEEQQVVSLGDASGRVAAFSAGGGQYVQLASAGAIGQVAQITPYGTIKVTGEPMPLFTDTFPTIDTVNKWTSGGTVPPQASGGAVFAPGTTASASATLVSFPTFTSTSNQTTGVFAVALEVVAVTGTHRFWGYGTAPGTPTATNPLQDAIGFEVDTAGALRASAYVGGTRVSTTVLTYPGDGQTHVYQVGWSGYGLGFYVDGFETPLVTAASPLSGSSILPVRITQYNGATTLSATPTFTVRGLGVSDSANPATMIADATMPWRRTVVSAAGVLSAGMPDSTVSGSINMTSTGGTVTALTSGVGVIGMQIAGTWTGTIALEATTDAVNWFAVNGVQSGTGAFTSAVTTTGQWRVNAAGYASVRARSSISGTGTATVVLVASAPSTMITAAEPIQVRGLTITASTVTLTTTGTFGPVDVSSAGNVTFTASGGFGGTIAGVIEQTNDGTNWYPAFGVRSDTGLGESVWSLAAGSNRMWDLGCEGITFVRIRLTTGPSSSSVVFRAIPGGLAFSPSVNATVQDPPKTGLSWYTQQYAVTATDTLVTVTGVQRVGVAVTTAAMTVTTGKTLRILAICGSITLVSATAAQTRINLRANPAGAATATSPMHWTVRKGASALTIGTVYDFDTAIPGGLEFPSGTGVAFSAVAAAASLHTLDLTMIGYEF